MAPTHQRALIFAGMLCLFVLHSPSRAGACGTCSVGDRTLTVMGAGQPFQHRLRLSVTGRHRVDAVGTPQVNAVRLREQRLELGVAYSPTDRWTLSVLLPLVRRDLRFVNLGREVRLGSGDIDLRARAVLYRDRALGARHLLSAVFGFTAPTARVRRNQAGQALPLEFQAGTGSWDPMLGLSYAHFADPWSVNVTAVLRVPTGRDGFRVGPSAQFAATTQLQPWDTFGVRFGALMRVDGVTVENGQNDPDSGGVIAYASAGLIVSPVPDLILQAGLSVPFLEALRGEHREGVALQAGVSLDL